MRGAQSSVQVSSGTGEMYHAFVRPIACRPGLGGASHPRTGSRWFWASGTGAGTQPALRGPQPSKIGPGQAANWLESVRGIRSCCGRAAVRRIRAPDARTRAQADANNQDQARRRRRACRPDALKRLHRVGALPGIARGYPPAGRAEVVAVDDGGVDLAQARGRGKRQVRRRKCCIRPEQPLDRPGDVVRAGRLFE